MEIIKSFKFRLILNNHQEELCRKTSGCCRWVWNHALSLKESKYQEDKTNLTKYDLINKIPEWKSDNHWLKEPLAQTLQQVIGDLNKAYISYFKKISNKPIFKKKSNNDSFRIPQHIKLLPNLNHKIGVVKLDKLGEVRFIETCEILGNIQYVTISRKANQWYISFCCKNVDVIPYNKTNSTVGIDLGINTTVQCSDGNSYCLPSSINYIDNKIKILQKKYAKKLKKSKNKLKIRLRVSKLHKRKIDIRRDFNHKISTKIVKNHDVVFIEDLKISNMSKSSAGTIENPGKNVKAKSGLNRSILNQGWGDFKVMLGYKTLWNDKVLYLVDPQFTSQKCSVCGYTHKDNRKTQALFACLNCGYSSNADVNASKNIQTAGLAGIAYGGEINRSPCEVGTLIRSELS